MSTLNNLSLQRPIINQKVLIEIESKKNKKTINKPLKKTEKKEKRNINDKVLIGNGFHKAVGILKGILKESHKTKIDENGKKVSLKSYKLFIDEKTSIKANLIFGVRPLVEQKPDEVLGVEHTYIVYPKFNKKGDFFVDIVAFDNENKSDIQKVCSHAEFVIVGVWYKDKIIVQQSQNKKSKKSLRLKRYSYAFSDKNDFNFLNNNLYRVKVELNTGFKFMILESNLLNPENPVY